MRPLSYVNTLFIYVCTAVKRVSSLRDRLCSGGPEFVPRSNPALADLSFLPSHADIRFEGLKATSMKMAAFLDVASRSLVDDNRRFRGAIIALKSLSDYIGVTFQKTAILNVEAVL